MHLFLAVLGLPCCASVVEVRGLSGCSSQALELGLSSYGPQAFALCLVGSSQTRGHYCVPCISREIRFLTSEPSGKPRACVFYYPCILGALPPPRLAEGFPSCSASKDCLQCGRPEFDPWVGKTPWRRERLPLQYSGLENYVDCTVHAVAESDTTE